jgi:hypothetical protein
LLVGGVESVGQVRWGLEGEEVLVVILVGSGREGVLAMVEHMAGIVGCEGAGLGPKIQENGIGFPAAEGADSSLVDAGDEESGGAAGAEAVGDDPAGGDVRDVFDRSGGCSEGRGDVAGGDVVRGARDSVEVAVQGAVRQRVVAAEVEDPTLGCADGAESGVARAAVAKGFAAGGILLVGVGETDVSPHLHVIRRALGGRSALDGGAAEGGVPKAERFAAAAIGGRGEGVLPRPAKKVETDGGKVGDGLRSVTVGVELEGGGEGPEDGDVDGPDAGRSRVVVGPGFEEGTEPVGIPSPVQSGILEAQSGELLADGA